MLAPPEADYVLENPNEIPTLQLCKQFFPVGPDIFKSVPIKGSEEPGFSAIHRNKVCPHKTKKFVLKGWETVYNVFTDVASQVGDSPCLKYRPYDYDKHVLENYYLSLSFSETTVLKNRLASGIIYQLQNNPYKQCAKFESHQKIDNHIRDYESYDIDNHSFIVTLYSGNRYEWIITDLACASYSITSTALYDTLGENTSEYILGLTQSPIVVCSKEHIKTLIDLKAKTPELASLISIVSMDPLFPQDDHLVSLADKAQIKLLDFYQVIGLGEVFPLNPLPPSDTSMYTISFSSGTTGANPKGVCLTHGNAVASLAFLLPQYEATADGFSFLPYAHIFERETAFTTLATGGCLVLPRLNYTPADLVEDLKLAKPTKISLVPRVLNKFEAVIKNSTINNMNLSSFKRGLFERAFEYKMKQQCSADGNEGTHFVYDKLIIKKIRQLFGFDNLQLIITGSAPIDPETVKFLKAAFQVGISQGYGSTETFAGFCLTQPFEMKPGSSGVTAVSTEVRVREIPDMNYRLTDNGGPRGELLIRGAQNFTKYYKDNKQTEESHIDGWFYSGDIVQIDNVNGKITIIDRVKNFFKLAQGEFIAPESIENKYLSNNSLLSQIYVYGDPTKSYLVGVLGITKEAQIEFLANCCNIPKRNLGSLPDLELLSVFNEKSNREILVARINAATAGISQFQKIKNAFIEFEPLTLERDVVTPTMKVKRPFAKKYFADVIEQLYQEGPIVNGTKL